MRARLLGVVATLWRSEPVRTVLAPVILTLIVAGLVKAGVDGSVAGIVATVMLGALGFTAQEIARAKVIPVGKAKKAEGLAIADTLSIAQTVLNREGLAAGDLVDRIASKVPGYIGQHRR